ENLEQDAMHLIGARLQLRIQHASCRPSVFGVIAVGQDVQLADGLYRGADHERGLVDEVDDVDVIVYAVEEEVVLAGGSNSVGAEPAALRIARALFGRQDARRHASQKGKRALSA